jgi:6-phosphogluconolactonase
MSKGGNDSGVMAPGPMSGDPPLEVADRGFTLAVYANPAALAHATAVYVMERAFRAVRGRGFFGLALAGGSTPEATYRLLAGAPFSASMPWGSTDVFWTDERCVDPLDRRSNEHMAREALLDHVPVDPGRVHPMRCDPGDPSGGAKDGPGSEVAARACADRYDSLLASSFPAEPGSDSPVRALDLVLLGLGEDGHTASLFPGPGPSRATGAAEAVFADAATNAGTTAGARDLWRVTMTPSFINRAAAVVFLVTGASKAAAVKEVIQGPRDAARLPAQLIAPYSGVLRWHLDQEAAALLDLSLEGGSS